MTGAVPVYARVGVTHRRSAWPYDHELRALIDTEHTVDEVRARHALRCPDTSTTSTTCSCSTTRNVTCERCGRRLVMVGRPCQHSERMWTAP